MNLLKKIYLKAIEIIAEPFILSNVWEQLIWKSVGAINNIEGQTVRYPVCKSFHILVNFHKFPQPLVFIDINGNCYNMTIKVYVPSAVRDLVTAVLWIASNKKIPGLFFGKYFSKCTF